MNRHGPLHRWIRKKDLSGLRSTLLKAGYQVLPEVYYARSLIILISGVTAGFALGFTVFYALLGADLLRSAVGSAFLGAVLGFGCQRLYLSYPGVVVRRRAGTIDSLLPQAATYLYGAVTGGSSLLDAMESVSRLREEFKDFAEEAGKVIRLVRYLNYDISAAVLEVARTTPSEKLAEFLEGISTIMRTGGSLVGYLEEKSAEYRKEVSLLQKTMIETVGIFSEFYVIAFLLLPLMLLITFQVFAVVAGGYFIGGWAVVLIFIPMGSLMSMVILDALVGKVGIPIIRPPKSGGVGRSTLHGLAEEPLRILPLSGAAGAALGALCIFWGLHPVSAFIVFSLVTIVPAAIAEEMLIRRIAGYEGAFPDFLRGFSGGLKSGLSSPLALRALKPESMGALGGRTREMVRLMELGCGSVEALRRFAEGTRSGLIHRTIILIENSIVSGGETAKVADIAKEDVGTEEMVRRERAGATTSYLVVVYIALGVFMLVSYAMTTSVLSGSITPISGISGGAVGGGMGWIRDMWFAACAFQGLFSGVVIGKLRNGRIASGFKHSALMLIVTLAFFMLVYS